MMPSPISATLVAALLLFTAQAPACVDDWTWGLVERETSAARRLAPAAWDLELLSEDIDASTSFAQPHGAMRYLPAPTVEYHSAGSLDRRLRLTIGAASVHCMSFNWGCFEFNAEICDGQSDRNYRNVLLLVDSESPRRSSKINSRSFPHVQAWNSTETSIGDVVWDCVGYASGESDLRVNCHIFDLRFGRTLLVAPQEHGSLRFQQLLSPNITPDGKGGASLSEFFTGC